MTRAIRLSLLLSVLSALVGVSTASPIDDAQVRDFLVERDTAIKPLHFARRDAAGIKNRHLRPEDHILHTKRGSVSSPDVGQIANFNGADPEPIRGATGDTFISNSNHAIDMQNVDNVAAPTTDAGTVPNLKWSMSLSHTRLLKGGWVREQVITDLPPAKDVAGAELRLSPNAYRELHWHRVAEWGYVLGGTGRITAVDENGRNYISDIKGPTNMSDPDIYYFPPGVPHSIQALGDGLELLLIFTDGNFDGTGTTFMLSDWLAHTPLEVVAKSLGVNTSILGDIPQKDPYIYEATVPPPPLGQADEEAVSSPQGTIPSPYVFQLSKQEKGHGSRRWWMDEGARFSDKLPSIDYACQRLGIRRAKWDARTSLAYQ
ncbi:hypothetical protein EW026_g4571 [Hermanssonia centrifuga]|uniref:Cupin type-1 domain-containing protein n=1 Tax=Hermanssonia centrifuga TaxID=98765 RepID=A0A4S4KL89_9APHY|nr:hypothetical protein EW026_g4571 [Hermanssonia centrifuga]